MRVQDKRVVVIQVPFISLVSLQSLEIPDVLELHVDRYVEIGDVEQVSVQVHFQKGINCQINRDKGVQSVDLRVRLIVGEVAVIEDNEVIPVREQKERLSEIKEDY